MVTSDRRQLLGALGGGAALGLAGCLESAGERPAAVGGRPRSADRESTEDLVLAATTSTQDSGLLAHLLGAFTAESGLGVRPVVSGSGAALRTAADGDADLVLVHAPDAEDDFLEAGHGLNRRAVMANDFLVVGPHDDLAGVAGFDRPGPAFAAIARQGAPFLSRGDGSGTHAKEQALWDRAGVEPGGRWYRQTGQGQGETLAAADQQGAYALVDRGTYLTMADRLGLAVHMAGPMAGGPDLLWNPYHVIPVAPRRADVAYRPAMALVAYLTAPIGQRQIADFRIDGRRAFEPTAGPGFDQYVPAGYREG